MRNLIAVLIVVFAAAFPGSAQDVTVNRSNKTIEVTVTATADADSEVGVLSLGYTAYGLTNEAAFAENVRAAGRILRVLSEAGVPKTSIETQQLRLERVEPNDKWTAEERAERQFTAAQYWDVRVPVAGAQSVLDAAIRAGANELSDVGWQVKDADALGTRATAAALDKARNLAQQIATGLGAKLGELLYASNTVRKPKGLLLETENAVAPPPPAGAPQLKLFPQKVEQEATVHAIFAID